MTPAAHSPEYAAHRKRLFVMLGIVGVCFLVAAGTVAGYVKTHEPWMLLVFAGAILGGFGAQAWLIVRFMQTGRPKA